MNSRIQLTIYKILLLFIVLQLHPADLFAAGEFKVSLQGEKLSVTAEKVPLQNILLELARSNISVKIDPSINPLVTASFKGRNIEAALESLLKTASYSLLWESRTGMDRKSSVRLAEIQVFQSNRRELMKALVPQRVQEISKNNDGALYVKGEVLLLLPAGFDLEKLESLVRSYGGTIVRSNTSPGLVKIILPPETDVFLISREIKAKLGIDVSQPNFAYPIEEPAIHASGKLRKSPLPLIDSPPDANIPVAILDSGLSDSSGLDELVVASLDVMSPYAPVADTLGHGTQMAYIASGVITPYGDQSETGSYLPIVPIRAFADDGYTSDFKMIDAINFALANNARVMSLSWGSETRSDVLEKALDQAHAQGLIIVASAGNEPTGKPVYPAAYPSVIGVGALDPHGKTWESSNYGDFVVLYAPGFANLPVGYNGDPGLYAGTSISTALVANSIGSYLAENPEATQKDVLDFLDRKY